MKNIFKINIYTYLFIILCILSGYLKNIYLICSILFVHEIGHFIIMKYYNIDVYSIEFYPYGGMIKSNMLINTNSLKVLIISLGGILFQIILYLFFCLLLKLNLININIYELFYKYNKFIIIFNLLPIIPLDGYKIFNSIFELFFSYKISIYISFILNIIVLFLFLIYLYIYRINNYLIIMFLFISLIKYIKEYKYLINKFYLERIMYDLKLKGMISVNKINSLYKNKFNYINGCCEDIILNKMYGNK